MVIPWRLTPSVGIKAKVRASPKARARTTKAKAKASFEMMDKELANEDELKTVTFVVGVVVEDIGSEIAGRNRT